MQIKSGATRHVFLIGTKAIKIPRCTHWHLFLTGLLANMQERRFSGVFENLALCWGDPLGFFIVMPRASPLSDEAWASVNVDEWADMVESKQDSFGMIDGKVVAVDYGS